MNWKGSSNERRHQPPAADAVDSSAVQPFYKARQVIAKRKAVQGHNTRTAKDQCNLENNMTTIKKIAAYAGHEGAASRAILNPVAGFGKLEKARKGACATIHSGASHTTKQAFKLYVNELFSRPEFATTGLSVVHGFGAGSAYPQGRQHNLFCVTTPSSTLCPSQANGGFRFNKERETMTKINTPTTSKSGTIARQQAIEDALESAMYFIRTDHPGYSLCLATARARRALSLLKQACADAAKNGGAA